MLHTTTVLTDVEALAIAALAEASISQGLTGGPWSNNNARRVLETVTARRQAGVAISLTARESAVLRAAQQGVPIPRHPYGSRPDQPAQWCLTIIRARKVSSCWRCDGTVAAGEEIAHWAPTMQWGHRACVQGLADSQPPTAALRRQSFARSVSSRKYR